MKPSGLLLVSYVDADQKRRMETLLRGHEGRRLTSLQMASAVRSLAEIAPLRCGCGCRTHRLSLEAPREGLHRDGLS